MKVTVDENVCIGSGNCEATAPEIFEVKEGKSHVKKSDVSGDLEQKARRAVEGCPSGAISVS